MRLHTGCLTLGTILVVGIGLLGAQEPPPRADGSRGPGDRPSFSHNFFHGREDDSGRGRSSHGFSYHHGDWDRMRESDPEMYALSKADFDLERQTSELGERYRKTTDEGEKAKLKQELIELVAKHFEVRQQKRELELQRLAEQLERMKESVAKRVQSKDAILKARIDELVGENAPRF